MHYLSGHGNQVSDHLDRLEKTQKEVCVADILARDCVLRRLPVRVDVNLPACIFGVASLCIVEGCRDGFASSVSGSYRFESIRCGRRRRVSRPSGSVFSLGALFLVGT